MEATPEIVDEIMRVLIDKFPRYHFEFNVTPNYDEYSLKYEGYSGTNSFKNNFGRKVDELIFTLKRQKSFQKITKEYVQILIDELSKAIHSFELLEIREKEFYFQRNSRITAYNGIHTEYTIEDVKNQFFQRVVKVSQLKYDFTNRLIDGLKEVLSIEVQIEPEENIIQVNQEENVEPTSSFEFSKLKINLPVSDIALLFRLLEEEGLINCKHKTEIYRFISATIESKNQENISVASIKNKFGTPDNSTTSNIDALLVNLRIHLKNIQ